MANNLVTVISADTSRFTRAINEAQSVLSRYAREARTASGSISTCASVTDAQVTSYQRLVRAMQRVSNGTMTTSQAERALVQQIQELRIQWANLSDDARRSDFGRALSESMASAERQLEQVRTQIRQTREELDNLSSASEGFDLSSIGNSINSLRSGDISGFVSQLQALRNISLGSIVSSVGALGASLSAAIAPVAALVGGIAALGYTVSESISSVSDFETHLDGLQSLTGLGDDAMKSIADGAIEMSKGFKSSASEIVDSMKLIGSQAPELLKNQDALMKVTEAANVLSEAAGIEVVDAAKGITTVMNQMGASASEATNIINVLAASSQQGSADVAYLNTAFEKAGTAAKSAGMDYTQLAAAIETIAPKFSSADVAGSTLNSTLLALSVQANDKFKPAVVGMDQALQNLAKAEMDDIQMKNLVGASNITMLKTLIEAKDTFKGFESSLAGTNTAYEQMAINTDNLDGTINGLKSNWEALLLTLGESEIIQGIIQLFQQVMTTLTELINYISATIKEFEGLGGSINIVDALGAVWKATVAIIKAACEIIEVAIAAVIKLFQKIGQVVRSVWGSIKQTLKDVGFFEPIRNACKSVITWFTNMVQKIQGVWTDFKRWLGLNVASTKITVDNEVGDAVGGNKPSRGTSSSGSTSSGTSSTASSGKKTGRTPKETTTKVTTKPQYKEGSLGKIEEDISKKQAELKIAISDKDRQRIQGEINDLTKKKEAIELSLKVKPDEGSLQAIEDAISQKQKELKLAISDEDRKKIQQEINDLTKKKEAIELSLKVQPDAGSIQSLEDSMSKKQKELKLAVSDSSREQIQKEIDELTGQKQAIEILLKPAIDDKGIEGLKDKISQHSEKKQPSGNKVSQAETKADNLKEELKYNQDIVKSYKEQYKAVQSRLKAGVTLTTNESELADIYEDAKKKVDDLTSAYDNAARSAEQLKANSTFNKKMYAGIKGTVKTIGSLNDSVVGVTGTWENMAESWNDMSTFKKVTSSISAVISTINEAMGAYEAISDVVQLFGEISEASAAKKVAADATEMASDSTKTALSTANTQVEIANNQQEQMSDLAGVGTKQASAIASATASGAKLPFPANLAAIAAGIAAVVAAFAMISSFADGGIIGGNTTLGDMNIARVNKGEMILNGTQQKRLFSILDGGVSASPNNITSGNVKFEIKGSTLVGVLKNHNSKMNKVG